MNSGEIWVLRLNGTNSRAKPIAADLRIKAAAQLVIIDEQVGVAAMMGSAAGHLKSPEGSRNEPSLGLLCSRMEPSPRLEGNCRSFGCGLSALYLYFVRSRPAPVLFQAHNIGGPEPTIFAVPRPGRVFGPIFFGNRPLPKENLVPMLVIVHAFPLYTSRRKRRKTDR